MRPPARRRGRSSLRTALAQRVVVADGAMGTMLQAHDLALDDFEGYEGCNESSTSPGPTWSHVHDAYFEVGCDAVETNTFGANLANLAEYGISDRIHELARGRRADRPRGAPTLVHPGRTRAGCSARSGPGTKLPTLGHAPFARPARRLPAQVAGHDRRRRRRAS